MTRASFPSSAPFLSSADSDRRCKQLMFRIARKRAGRKVSLPQAVYPRPEKAAKDSERTAQEPRSLSHSVHCHLSPHIHRCAQSNTLYKYRVEPARRVCTVAQLRMVALLNSRTMTCFRSRTPSRQTSPPSSLLGSTVCGHANTKARGVGVSIDPRRLDAYAAATTSSVVSIVMRWQRRRKLPQPSETRIAERREHRGAGELRA